MLRRSCCPRCKGDVRLDRDEYGWYEECIMCGYVHDMASAAQKHVPEPVRERVRARRAA